jgi:hypothetical protein
MASLRGRRGVRTRAQGQGKRVEVELQLEKNGRLGLRKSVTGFHLVLIRRSPPWLPATRRRFRGVEEEESRPGVRRSRGRGLGLLVGVCASALCGSASARSAARGLRRAACRVRRAWPAAAGARAWPPGRPVRGVRLALAGWPWPPGRRRRLSRSAAGKILEEGE